jgi:teichuronic acid biosynthesis glycosyltransferase TuaC
MSSGVAGTLCAEFAVEVWQAALAPYLAADDPRVDGRARAEAWSTDAMAARVIEAWRGVLG